MHSQSAYWYKISLQVTTFPYTGLDIGNEAISAVGDHWAESLQAGSRGCSCTRPRHQQQAPCCATEQSMIGAAHALCIVVFVTFRQAQWRRTCACDDLCWSSTVDSSLHYRHSVYVSDLLLNYLYLQIYGRILPLLLCSHILIYQALCGFHKCVYFISTLCGAAAKIYHSSTGTQEGKCLTINQM